jgi:hypothetical protein
MDSFSPSYTSTQPWFFLRFLHLACDHNHHHRRHRYRYLVLLTSLQTIRRPSASVFEIAILHDRGKCSLLTCSTPQSCSLFFSKSLKRLKMDLVSCVDLRAKNMQLWIELHYYENEIPFCLPELREWSRCGQMALLTSILHMKHLIKIILVILVDIWCKCIKSRISGDRCNLPEIWLQIIKCKFRVKK